MYWIIQERSRKMHHWTSQERSTMS